MGGLSHVTPQLTLAFLCQEMSGVSSKYNPTQHNSGSSIGVPLSCPSKLGICQVSTMCLETRRPLEASNLFYSLGMPLLKDTQFPPSSKTKTTSTIGIQPT